MSNDKKAKLKTVLQKQINTITVSEEGEILAEDLEYKNFKYLVNSKEEFFLLYSSIFSVFCDLNGVEIKLFAKLLEMFNVSYFSITKPLKIKIAEKIKCSPRSLDNAIKSLIDANLIYRDNRTLYLINPRYAWKGSTKDRNFNLQILLEKCPDC